jgi:hypothetical protein
VTPAKPRVSRGWRKSHGVWTTVWCVTFTPTDPDTPSIQWRDTWAAAWLLALRIQWRQGREA